MVNLEKSEYVKQRIKELTDATKNESREDLIELLAFRDEEISSLLEELIPLQKEKLAQVVALRDKRNSEESQ